MMTMDDSICCGAADCALPAGKCETDAGMEFIRCPTCQVLRIPEDKIIHRVVLPDPKGDLSLVMRVLMSLRMIWLRGVLQSLRNKAIVILDVGCGDGQFLQFLRERGYRHAVGIEPDPERRMNALARKVPVYESVAAAQDEERQPINAGLVVVWHVLEHIPKPADFLREYAGHLAPGGSVIISVPNQNSIQTRLFGYYSAYPDYGRHLWYHDRSYTAWLKKQLPELSVSVLPDFNFEYEVFAWVDSIVSFALHRQNAVHKTLKKGEGSARFRLVMALTSLALLPLAALLSCVSLATGRGSTLTFVASRNEGR